MSELVGLDNALAPVTVFEEGAPSLAVAAWDALSHCYEYPTAGLGETALGAISEIERSPVSGAAVSGMVAALRGFVAWTESVTTQEAEERYTQLFDMKPVATLNVSHHLLGDSYQRGMLLAGLAGELKDAEVDFVEELPDYLPVLLRLVARQRSVYDRRVLTHTIVMPGLVEVGKRLASSPGPYPALLGSLVELLSVCNPVGDEPAPVLHRPEEVSQCST